MPLLLICLLISIVILLYILFKKWNINILITVICTIIILWMIINPQSSIRWTIEGTKIFFYSLFPSLFPFLVICNLMISYNGVDFYSKILGKLICSPIGLSENSSIVLVISALCGYPLGAKYTCEVYEKGLISYEEAERLLNIATNPSPLFIIGSVGVSLLKNTPAGYIILISCYLSPLLISLLTLHKKNKYNKSYINNYSCGNINSNNIKFIEENKFKFSIESAIKNSLMVGGFVVIFYIITNIIKSNPIFRIALSYICTYFSIDPSIIQGLFLGLIEMTNGCYLIASSKGSLIIDICLISFLVNFSGLSIITQAYSFIKKDNFSLKLYISRKLLQGVLGSLISVLISYLLVL